jgi:hypothetical protein
MRAILTLSVAAVVFSTASPAWARLGETEEQCGKRYGGASVPEGLISNFGRDAKTPTLKEDKVLQYTKDGMTIYVGFIDGKASSIQYSFFMGRKTPLQRHEVEALIQINAPDRQWYYNFEHPFLLTSDPPEELGKDSGIFWSTDGEYYAFFSRGVPIFTISRMGLRPIFRFENTEPKSLEGL